MAPNWRTSSGGYPHQSFDAGLRSSLHPRSPKLKRGRGLSQRVPRPAVCGGIGSFAPVPFPRPRLAGAALPPVGPRHYALVGPGGLPPAVPPRAGGCLTAATRVPRPVPRAMEWRRRSPPPQRSPPPNRCPNAFPVPDKKEPAAPPSVSPTRNRQLLCLLLRLRRPKKEHAAPPSVSPTRNRQPLFLLLRVPSQVLLTRKSRRCPPRPALVLPQFYDPSCSRIRPAARPADAAPPQRSPPRIR